MRRFEQLQSQLGRLPQDELQGFAGTGQQLHERFVELQEKLRSAGGGGRALPASLEGLVLTFHRDLALFVDRVESRLGIQGPVVPPPVFGTGGGAFPPQGGGLPPLGAQAPGSGPGLSAGAFGAGAFGGAGAASGGPGAVTPATDRRLQVAMGGVVDGMQRFEALHPRLQMVPQPVFQEIAQRAQRLHEEFVRLQRLGVELGGDGSSPMSETAAAPYAAQLEAFVAEQAAFVRDAESTVGQHTGASAGGFGGFVGGGVQMPPMPGAGCLGGSLGGGLPPAGLRDTGSFGGGGIQMPPMGSTQSSGGFAGGLGGAGAGAGAGSVTPATDRRLSAVIQKVVALLQEFEGLKPRIAGLPPQALNPIAQRGQLLHEHFQALQQRGATLAGDGQRPMSESDASSYAEATLCGLDYLDCCVVV